MIGLPQVVQGPQSGRGPRRSPGVEGGGAGRGVQVAPGVPQVSGEGRLQPGSQGHRELLQETNNMVGPVVDNPVFDIATMFDIRQIAIWRRHQGVPYLEHGIFLI